MMSHSDERAAKCPFCPKAYKRKEKLKGHMKKAHSEELIKEANENPNEGLERAAEMHAQLKQERVRRGEVSYLQRTIRR